MDITHKFKPFDKVIVCKWDNYWKARHFEKIEHDVYFCTDGEIYKQCLPYSEETAKLIGTSDTPEQDNSC